MARIRTIKPDFFTSLTIADLTAEQRLTFIGLWTHADDAGRCVDDARLIKAAIWPLDDRTAADIEIDLKALTESSLITRYTLKRKRYLAVTNWDEHQRINRPTESKLPAPEDGDPTPPEPVTRHDGDSLNTHAQLSEDSRQERKGKEGNREGKGRGASAEADGQAELVVVSDADFVGAAGAAPEDSEPVTAQTIVGEWLQRANKRPPGNVIGQTAKQIKNLLDEGIAPDDIRAGLAKWMRKGSAPSAIPSFVNEAMNAAPQQSGGNVFQLPSGQPLVGTDAKVAGWMALAEQLRQEGDPA